MTSLADFHATMASFLRGHIGLSRLNERLGSSPSGDRRMQFYRLLMRRNVTSILRKLHTGAFELCERKHKGLWNELVESYTEKMPPDHYDPNRFCAGFSSFISERRKTDSRLEPYLEEVADYQWIYYIVGVEPFNPTASDIGIDRTLYIRQYEYDVPRFIRQLHSGKTTREPQRRPTTLLVYRDPATLRAALYHPTALGLLALADKAGLNPDVSTVAPEFLAKAEQQLRDHGILPAN